MCINAYLYMKQYVEKRVDRQVDYECFQVNLTNLVKNKTSQFTPKTKGRNDKLSFAKKKKK